MVCWCGVLVWCVGVVCWGGVVWCMMVPGVKEKEKGPGACVAVVVKVSLTCAQRSLAVGGSSLRVVSLGSGWGQEQFPWMSHALPCTALHTTPQEKKLTGVDAPVVGKACLTSPQTCLTVRGSCLRVGSFGSL